jgi:hypothetical protein
VTGRAPNALEVIASPPFVYVSFKNAVPVYIPNGYGGAVYVQLARTIIQLEHIIKAIAIGRKGCWQVVPKAGQGIWCLPQQGIGAGSAGRQVLYLSAIAFFAPGNTYSGNNAERENNRLLHAYKIKVIAALRLIFFSDKI